MGAENLNDLVRWFVKWRDSGVLARLSEIDTQVLLVEPVLAMAGWDLGDPRLLRRASRDNRRAPGFDIELFGQGAEEGVLHVAVEVKSFSSREFNLERLSSGTGAGRLTPGDGAWKNRAGDGLGRLQAYCAALPQFDHLRTLPVITNGHGWVVFRKGRFARRTRLGHALDLSDLLAAENIESLGFLGRVVSNLA